MITPPCEGSLHVPGYHCDLVSCCKQQQHHHVWCCQQHHVWRRACGLIQVEVMMRCLRCWDVDTGLLLPDGVAVADDLLQVCGPLAA
jgi:hypothetical protein